MSVNNELLNRAIRHAVYLEQIKAKEVARMMRFMDSRLLPDLERLLASRLSAVGLKGGGMRAKRFTALIGEVKALLSEGMGSMRRIQADRMIKVGNLEAQWQAGALRQTVPLDMTFRTPTIGAIRSALTSKPMQGRLLSKWYSDLATSTAKNISDQLTMGFLQGESIDRLSARIMGIPNIEKSFAGTSTRAQVRRHVRTVTRTATNHIASNARDLTYAENKDIIKRVRYVATLDSRTSDVCQSLDGQEFPVGQGERPPMHHQCRSTTVPITMSWKELGIKGAKDARLGGRAFRDVKTGLNGISPKEISYGQWLKMQSSKVQDHIFGASQAKLFRSGKVKFDRFFDNGRKLSIRELARREGIQLGKLN
jgi:SPP1 gp7 family putative phage head morphogenesis protein